MQNKKIEYTVILVGWTIVFALPAIFLYYESLGDDSSFDWHELLFTWKHLLPLFVLFLLHHFLLFPLYSKRRFIVYAILVVALLGLFTCFQIFALRPQRHDDFRPHPQELALHPMPEEEFDERIVEPRFRHPHPDGRRFGHPRKMFPGRIVMECVIALLLMGVDLGVFVQVASRRTRQQLLVLEKEKLEMELSYLKYQVNPHFFMNTLNNIHALVDIDTELAKRTVIDLSHLMRYALYDSASELVPLSKEVEFIQLYINLMRLRYSGQVRLELEVQEGLSGVMVPPLLLICFVENAFKHGVSNREPSFVEMHLSESQDGKYLQFDCTNSRLHKHTSDAHHGIGIANARKRLDLLYADSYSLTIDDQDENQFKVCLKLPIKKS